MPPPWVVRSRAATKVLTESPAPTQSTTGLPATTGINQSLPWLAAADDVDVDGCGGGGGVPFLLHPTRAFFLFGRLGVASGEATLRLFEGVEGCSFEKRCRKGVTLL